jgi:hypothetical protein
VRATGGQVSVCRKIDAQEAGPVFSVELLAPGGRCRSGDEKPPAADARWHLIFFS